MDVTPFVGVWIETDILKLMFIILSSHPSWVCGLKLLYLCAATVNAMSHPSWVCGLKLVGGKHQVGNPGHTLRGCVD